MQLYVGCSGWKYRSWLGRFYPKQLEPGQFLDYYSKIFDYVEIDSTFNKMPERFVSMQWLKLTPDNFRFTAKFPQIVTHEKRLDAPRELEYFFEMIQPLQEKTLALLIQLPPSMTADEGLGNLEKMIHSLDGNFRYALEPHHKSWFRKDVYKLLKKYSICLAWSQGAQLETPPEQTTDFFYLRFSRDGIIDRKDSGKRQKEMEKWAAKIKWLRYKKEARFGIVAASNNYAGFGPATANTFRIMAGLSKVTWEDTTQHAVDGEYKSIN